MFKLRLFGCFKFSLISNNRVIKRPWKIKTSTKIANKWGKSKKKKKEAHTHTPSSLLSLSILLPPLFYLAERPSANGTAQSNNYGVGAVNMMNWRLPLRGTPNHISVMLSLFYCIECWMDPPFFFYLYYMSQSRRVGRLTQADPFLLGRVAWQWYFLWFPPLARCHLVMYTMGWKGFLVNEI